MQSAQLAVERRIDHPLYSTWEGIRQRCGNPLHDAFQWYGARGIKLCARWQEFWNFAADMGEKPEGRTVDRIDTNGDYEPGNCRWSNQSEQIVNSRLRKDNRSGIRGVFWFQRTCRWMVYIGRKGVQYDLGYYEDFFDACCVRKSAEIAPDIASFAAERKRHLRELPNKGNFQWRALRAS